MFTLLALAAVAFVVMAVLGLMASVMALVFWVLFLPFRILGFIFKGFVGLLALPFLVLFAIVGALIFGIGAIAFFLPLLPFALLVAGIWWLVNRRGPTPSPRTN